MSEDIGKSFDEKNYEQNSTKNFLALDKVDDGSEAVKSEDQNEAVKKLDLIVYSADQLMQLREVAVSKAWPSYLDEAFKNNRGTWDPDRWHQNKRKGSTPPPILEEPKEKGSNAKKDEGNENNGPNKVNDKYGLK